MPSPARKKAPPAARRAPRPDGDATRANLLETAGQVFAARGYADATSKEICERAGTPMASVNYHFGSRDALYEAVLIEAHAQIVGLDDLMEMTAALDDPRLKLRAVLAHLVGLSTRASAPWGFRVMLRELMSPSPVVPALVEKAMRPKARLLLGLIAEILGLPPGHPAVQRGLVFSVLPSVVLLVAPKELSRKVLPAVSSDGGALLEDLMRYVLAGLDALAREHAQPSDGDFAEQETVTLKPLTPAQHRAIAKAGPKGKGKVSGSML